MNLQSYIGLHLFELADLRKDLVDMKRKLNNIEWKKRLELIQDACHGVKKAQ